MVLEPICLDDEPELLVAQVGDREEARFCDHQLRREVETGLERQRPEDRFERADRTVIRVPCDASDRRRPGSSGRRGGSPEGTLRHTAGPQCGVGDSQGLVEGKRAGAVENSTKRAGHAGGQLIGRQDHPVEADAFPGAAHVAGAWNGDPGLGRNQFDLPSMVDGGAEMREDAGQPVGATAMLGHVPDDVPATPDSDDRPGVEGPAQTGATELGDELGPRRNAAQSGDRAAIRRLCHTWTMCNHTGTSSVVHRLLSTLDCPQDDRRTCNARSGPATCRRTRSGTADCMSDGRCLA